MNSNKILGYLSIIILVVFTAIGIYIKLANDDNVIIGKLFNPQYALENLLHIEITSKQDTSLLHFNSPERCYASFQ